MSSALMLERTGVAGVGVPGLGTPTVGTPAGYVSPNYLVVPRGTIKVEKCQGGLKLSCYCDDKMACSMVQNLCQMLQGSMCSVSTVSNGITVCSFNFTYGLCKCEPTESGVCITCTSGDQKCCEMLQACCDCICCMSEAGCTSYVCLNGTPICCGSCETSKSSTQKQQPKKA